MNRYMTHGEGEIQAVTAIMVAIVIDHLVAN